MIDHGRLDAASALVEVLLDAAAERPDPTRAEHHRSAALEQFEAAAAPSAVFAGARTLLRANRAWHALFADGAQLPDALVAAIDHVMASGASCRIDEIAIPGDLMWCTAALRAAGEPREVIVVVLDITDDVMEERLALHGRGIAWSGALGASVDYVDRRWRAYTDATIETWSGTIHPDDLARSTRAIAEANRLRSAADVEVRIRRADGSYCWHRLATVVHERRWIVTATELDDVRGMDTERRELLASALAARADAVQATRMKDQFLATVSHELRTPVTTLLLWEQVLRESGTDEAMRGRAIQAIHDSAVMQARLVGDLLDVSRAIAGKLYVDLRTVDIAEIVRDAIAAVTVVAQARGLVIELHSTAEPAEVEGDAGRLRQVLDNLLANAVKFTDHGRIDVTLRRSGTSIVIDVADTGRGIAPAFLERVFEPFSQTDDALTRESSGLGLGLAISHQLVALHRGELTASSAGLGHGATMTVTLPRGRRVSPPPKGATKSRLDRMRVLVIDDDQRVRDALALLLARAGASVETAESAAAARAQLARVTVDAVLCDIAMPGEDGYSFLEGFRASGHTTPAIALTAHALPNDLRRARAAGFDKHIAKPIDFDRLVDAIDALVAPR